MKPLRIRIDRIVAFGTVLSLGGVDTSTDLPVFWHLYADLGLAKCSSHSGRRTFITRTARLVFKADGSLRDVQQLAGHRSIHETHTYIDDGERTKANRVDVGGPRALRDTTAAQAATALRAW
jgi:integrase